MFLAADIGNSNIVISIHDGETWTHTFRYESKDTQPTIYYINGLSEILLEWGISGSISKAGISSVVPGLNETIRNAIKVVTQVQPYLLSPESFLKLDMHVPKVYEIGSDLVANSYAALKKYGKDSLIIDFGTALTFTIVTEKGGIEGVSFAPGLKTAMQSLSGNTAQLPEVWLSWPERALGKSTEEAIKSGVLIGYYGLVSELKKQILNEFPKVNHIIGTGGMVEILKPLKNELNEVNQNLTVEGIRLITTDLS